MIAMEKWDASHFEEEDAFAKLTKAREARELRHLEPRPWEKKNKFLTLNCFSLFARLYQH
jgi:hypothetical protein